MAYIPAPNYQLPLDLQFGPRGNPYVSPQITQYLQQLAASPQYRQGVLFPQYTQQFLPYPQQSSVGVPFPTTGSSGPSLTPRDLTDTQKSAIQKAIDKMKGQLGSGTVTPSSESAYRQQLIEQMTGLPMSVDEYRGMPIGMWKGSSFPPPQPITEWRSNRFWNMMNQGQDPLSDPLLATGYGNLAREGPAVGGMGPTMNMYGRTYPPSGAGAPPTPPPTPPSRPYNWANEPSGGNPLWSGATGAAETGAEVAGGFPGWASLGLAAAGPAVGSVAPGLINRYVPGPTNAKDILGNTIAGAGWGASGFALGPEVGIPTTAIGAGIGLGKGVLESIFG